jgi:hypothetical protein
MTTDTQLLTPLAIAAPLAAPEPDSDDRRGMFDLVLRGQKRLSVVLRDEAALPMTTQKLLALSLLGLAVQGLVLGLTAQLVHPSELAGLCRGHPIVWMPLAFCLAFVGTLGICLPSFYFYTQLSGLDASFRLVTAQALRAQATTSLLLLGALPFYAAYALACVLGVLGDPDSVVLGGLVLPFGVGLFGVHALYRGFCDLAEVLPLTHQRRGHFLRRMVLCWGALYSVVAPVALYRLAELLGGLI